MNQTKRVLVTGAGGFIAHHLIKRLKKEGYWIRGVDIKKPEFSGTLADDFKILDLRDFNNCIQAISPINYFDEVYHLAADMGGMGYIHSAECEIMRNNILMDSNMIHAAVETRIKRYFFSSSVCVYRDMSLSESELKEEEACPAQPNNEYGWEKLYAERMMIAYGRRYGIDVRIARFQNCYGPEGTWEGGREKAPAAICRKIAKADDGDSIEVWGDGTAVRSYTYVDDMVDGICCLMQSDIEGPTNIGSPEYVTVEKLVHTVAKIAGKKIHIKYIKGPVGVRSRNFSNEKIYRTGWQAKFKLKDAIELVYPWIEKQVSMMKNKNPMFV